MEEKEEKGGGKSEQKREERRQGAISPWDPWPVKLLKLIIAITIDDNELSSHLDTPFDVHLPGHKQRFGDRVI